MDRVDTIPASYLNTRIFSSGEFLLSGYEIKSTSKTKEGSACPLLPPLHSRSDDDVLHFLVVSHLGGAEAAGVKPQLSVQVF
jgi:hypothetical protein